MYKLHFKHYHLIMIAILSCLIMSCDDDGDDGPDITINPDNSDFFLGWDGQDEVETIPTSTNFGFGNGSTPSSVDLVSKFPPIGDQERYGTCVSWAVAYNMMTAINGMDQGLSTSQLQSTSNQFSPKDLFIAIPDSKKGNNCGGTNFSSALDILQSRGVARLQTVPYTSLGNCSRSNLQSSWTSEASQNKIKYWRKIDASVTSIKQNLANNIPVVFGAKLADNFMTWSSSSVLSSNTSYANVGQHAYHAMIIAGYDDSKGANGAFKVINSWGNAWGDNGYIWIDYNFFISQFCISYDGDRPLFIAAIDEGNVTPPNDPDPVATGVDVAPWVFGDFSTYNSYYPTERELDFNIYNIGNQTASPSSNWSFYYLWMDAYNSNIYDVIFYDGFNTSVPTNQFDCPSPYNCNFNYSIPSGSNFAQVVFGLQSLTRTYYMPQITGYYYLILIADAGDNLVEQDEINNLFYTSEYPIYFNYGFAARTTENASEFKFSNDLEVNEENLRNNKYRTAVTDEFPNAYTPEEIIELVRREKESGELDHRINEFKSQNESSPYPTQ